MKYTIRTFIQAPRCVKEGESPSGKVVIRVRWNGGRCEVGFFANAYANTDKWDTKLQRPFCKTSHTHNGKKIPSSVIRENIAALIDNIETAVTYFNESEKSPSQKEFKEYVYKQQGLTQTELILRRKRSKEKVSATESMRASRNIFDCIDAFIREKRECGEWGEASQTKYETLRNVLREFDARLDFDSLNLDKMIELQSFLIKRKYYNSTIREFFKRFNAFLHRCAIGEHPIAHVSKDALDFKCKLKDIPQSRGVFFLTKEELYKLYSCRFPSENQAWQRATDLFCFMAATSLRVSDIKKLKRSHIVGDRIDNSFMEKTDSRIIIPLNDISRSILKKYEEYQFKDDLALPIISEQKINEYLKKAAEWAGLTDTITIAHKCGSERIEETFRKCDKISCHWGRRTFVTIGLESGASSVEVRSITGHTTDAAMRPYVGLTMEEKINATAAIESALQKCARGKLKEKATEKKELVEKISQLPTAKLKLLLDILGD